VDGKYLNLNPRDVEPLHAVRIPSLYTELLGKMKAEGWNGRPLLVIQRENGYQAWTGSHRIAAARELNLQIPCYVLPEKPLLEIGKDSVSGHILNWERSALIRTLFPNDADAIHLMDADTVESEAASEVKSV